MKVWANVPVWGQSGWEVLCRETVLALDRMGIYVSLKSKNEWNAELLDIEEEDASRLRRMEKQTVTLESADLHILHQVPDDEYLKSVYFLNSRAKKVCLSLFETNRCPINWISKLNKMNEVWVYSNFNKEYWEVSGVKNIKVIPFGIDTRLFNASAKPALVKGRKKFMFISNGDFTERKWFEGVIEAFVTEFTDEEDVCLLIKAHYGGFVRRHKEGVRKKILETVRRFNKINPPMVLFYGDKVATKDMPRFYTAGDCFVLTSRGEGLGVPYAEALACGVPVIATGWGGQTEFLTNENSYLIDYTLDVINDTEYIRKCLIALNHSWATPNLTSLKSIMRLVYSFPEEAKKKALIGMKEMEVKTWDNVAKWVIANGR